MADELVLRDDENGVAILTLNRPDVYNAIDPALGEALLDAVVACDEDSTVRAVLLRGAGKAFCAGGDLKAMRAGADADGYANVFVKRLTILLHGIVATLARMEKPVIGALHGPAGGAGFSLALACDLVLAARSATLVMAYTNAGLAPDGGSTFLLPRIVGAKRAYDLIANNPVLSAAQAKDLGIVNEVLPDEGFGDAARDYAARLAAGPTRALGAAKRLLALSPDSGLETQMEHERRAIAASAATGDFKEGVAAFVEKRPPKFKGR